VTRQRATLLVATLLLVVLAAVASQLRVPYVVLSPGPVTDTLGTVPSFLLAPGQHAGPVISISGRPGTTQPSRLRGHLELTTVDETPGDCSSHPTLWTAIRAWFDRTDTVDPYQLACPPGQSSRAVRAEDAQQMSQSQTDAETAALLELGYHPSSVHITVGSLDPDAPAAAVLQPADVIHAVGGTAVTTVAQIHAALANRPVGSTVPVTISRDGKSSTVSIRTVAAAPASRMSALGISQVDRVATFPGVHIEFGIDPQVVGGPSAGTALALGIVDKLTPGGITGRRTVAGTGTVDGFGTVGPIGGIQQKVAGAVKAGATVFFAPASECADAKAAAPSSLTLVRVDTLHTAVTALQAIKAGSTDFPHC
jgi:PDZ domain-containing protein